jgi:hypothetical protein
MNTHDPVEKYFECISHCYLDDEEEACLSYCVEGLKEGQASAHFV